MASICSKSTAQASDAILFGLYIAVVSTILKTLCHQTMQLQLLSRQAETTKRKGIINNTCLVYSLLRLNLLVLMPLYLT
jgi:hypothetical protein